MENSSGEKVILTRASYDEIKSTINILEKDKFDLTNQLIEAKASLIMIENELFTDAIEREVTEYNCNMYTLNELLDKDNYHLSDYYGRFKRLGLNIDKFKEQIRIAYNKYKEKESTETDED